MFLEDSCKYLSHRSWFRAVLAGMDVVLCHTSALECLHMFSGYVHESQIYLYSKVPLPYENVKCYVVDSFDGMEIEEFGILRCTSFNQTVNDMLRDYDLIDDVSLAESLSDYYFSHGESFEGLIVEPQHAERFAFFKDWAMEYYQYG
jgi:hypothetical protein